MFKLTKLRLQTRIGLLVILGLVLIFTIMAWEGMQAIATTTGMALQERLTVAHVVALHLNQDLERTLSRLAQVAAFPTINLEDGDMEPEKAELRALYRPQVFSYVFLLDKDGLVLWSEPYLPEVVGVKHLECPHVQEILRTGQPAIACVAHALTPQNPVAAPVVPIHNREGAVVGALGGAIDPTSPAFGDLLRRVVPARTGYAQLVDENGIVLAHSEGRDFFQKSEHADLFISLLREKRADVATHTVTEEGKGTFREVIAFAPLTVAPWGVAVEQAEAELLAPALELRRRMILFGVATLAGALLLVWVTSRSVVEPVRKLVAASRRITAGDLTTPVPPLGQDEIGELRRSFEEMRGKLARWGEELETAVQQRTRELSILYTIDRTVAQSLNLEEVLNDALEATLEALLIEAGGIFLLEPDGETMTLRVYQGLSEEFVEAVRHIRLGEGVSGRAAAEGRPVVLDMPDYPTERLAPFIVREGFQTLASTPLLSAGKLLGALNLATRQPRAFPPEEMELLTAIGRQLGRAVANAQLHEETRRMRDYLQSVLDSSIDLIFTVKPDGTFGYFNPRLTRITGYQAKAIRGRPFLDFIPEDRQAFMLERWQEVTQGIGGTYETEIITADGRRIPVLVSHSAIAGFDEYVAILRDISSLKAAEQELEQRAERLSLLNRIARALSTTLNLDELLEVVHREVTAVMEADAFFIALYDRAANELDYRVQIDQGVREPQERGPLGPGLTSVVVTSKKPLLIRDFEREQEQYPEARLWGTMKAPPSWLGVPMLVGDRVVGVISVQAYRPNAYGDAEQELLSTIADAVAVAIENARLYEETKLWAKEMEVLAEVGRAISSTLDLDRVLQAIVTHATILSHSDEGGLFELDKAEGVLRIITNYNASEAFIRAVNEARVRVGEGAIGRVAATREPVQVVDTETEAGYRFREIAAIDGIRSILAVPLLRGDELIGGIVLWRRRPGPFSPRDVALLTTLANQAAIAVENARLYEKERQARQVAEALRDATATLVGSLELDQVLDRILEEVQRVIPHDAANIALVEGDRVRFVRWRGYERFGVDTRVPGLGFRIADTPNYQYMAETGQPKAISDTAVDPEWVQVPGWEWLRSYVGAPIQVREKLIGFLSLDSATPNFFNAGHARLVATFAPQIGVAIENARLFEAAQHEIAERQQAEEALRESERRYRDLYEGITDAVFVHDFEGKILDVNQVACERLGYARDELVGMSLRDIDAPEFVTLIPKRMQRVMAGDAPPFEAAHRTKDGRIIPVEVNARVVTYGGRQAIQSVMRDITERKQLEAQLRQAQKMEAIGQLAGGIAHDFNNLLTPIGGFAELLLWKAAEGSQQQEYLRQIKVAAERAAALTRQLRLFTRQAAGERRALQLNDVVEETHTLLERSIPKDIAIELRLASELWAVEADPTQISQVLMNLCLNAQDAMPNGGTLTLETRNVTLDEEYARTVLAARPGRYVCLTVSDTGCGMSPQVQARLFEPFFTTKEVGKGTGLGLAVVYGIVERHGGFIQVYSQEGRGSTFHVYLPAIESVVEERRVERLELPAGTETILLVDDEETVRALGQRVLEHCGYTVLVAGEGVQALEVYQAHQEEIGLVVLDVVMPTMSGLECLRRLRELDPRVRVLISTGYTARGLAEELVDEGALGVVEKPFLLRDFATAVRAALDQ